MSKNPPPSDLAGQHPAEIATDGRWSIYAYPHGEELRQYVVVDHSRDGASYRLAHDGERFRGGGDVLRLGVEHQAVACDVIRLGGAHRVVACDVIWLVANHARWGAVMGDAWRPDLAEWRHPDDDESVERFGVVIRPKIPGWSRPKIKNRNL